VEIGVGHLLYGPVIVREVTTAYNKEEEAGRREDVKK